MIMLNILRELYHGNIRPDCKQYEKDSPFMKAVRVKYDCLGKLAKTMDKRQKKLFEQYCDASREIEDIARYDNFSYALRLGVMLMVEVYDEGEAG